MNNIGNPDLIQQQFDLSERCDHLIKELARSGDDLANAEYRYNIRKSQVAFMLKERGESATMIKEVLKGQKDVAELRLKRDLAKSKYDATKETINIIKLQMRMNDNQISREWGRNE